MRLRVAADGAVTLEEPAAFDRFAVLATPGAPPAALEGIARLEGGHAWVSPAALRRLAPAAGTPDWDAGFARMLAYAGRQGWLDAAGAVRAHVETG